MKIDPIQAFLNEVAGKLPARSLRARRLVEEFEDHLRERASQLRRQGMSEEEAAVAAIAQFGSPDEVLQRLELESPIESEVDAMFRYVLMSAAALTFVFGAVFLALPIAFSTSPLEGFAHGPADRPIMEC